MPRGPCTLLPLHGHQWARRSSVLTSPSRSLALSQATRHGTAWTGAGLALPPSVALSRSPCSRAKTTERAHPRSTPAPRKHCGQLSGRSSHTLLGSIPPSRPGRESLAGRRLAASCHRGEGVGLAGRALACSGCGSPTSWPLAKLRPPFT